MGAIEGGWPIVSQRIAVILCPRSTSEAGTWYYIPAVLVVPDGVRKRSYVAGEGVGELQVHVLGIGQRVLRLLPQGYLQGMVDGASDGEIKQPLIQVRVDTGKGRRRIGRQTR